LCNLTTHNLYMNINVKIGWHFVSIRMMIDASLQNLHKIMKSQVCVHVTIKMDLREGQRVRIILSHSQMRCQKKNWYQDSTSFSCLSGMDSWRMANSCKQSISSKWTNRLTLEIRFTLKVCYSQKSKPFYKGINVNSAR
jgi:hypothetical protein